MKRTILTLTLLLLSTSVYSQSITIGEDGIVRCKGVAVGTTETLSGKIYEVVDRNLLIKRRDEGKDLTKACVSNVTDISGVFQYSEFNQPIGNWDVSSVTNMSWMFSVSEFNQPIGNWDVSSVIDMSLMFKDSPFNQPIGNWDVSSVIDMSLMFSGSEFNQPIGNWDVSSVTDMGGMFRDSPFNQPIGNWDVSSVTQMSQMFHLTTFNQYIHYWDVSNVTDMLGMFSYSKFNQRIGNWDVSSVSDMSYMFYESQFNQLINNWCVIKIKKEPEEFSTSSPLTPQNKPKWGTCPPRTQQTTTRQEGVGRSGDVRGTTGQINSQQGTSNNPTKSAPFSLKWDGDIVRSPLIQPLPDYVEDVEAVITVRFQVMPNGSINQIIPLRKMSPALEKEVMATLRSWRFQRLPSSVPQDPQWGTITFRFTNR